MRVRVLLPLLVLGLLTVTAVLIPIADSIASARTQQLALQRASALDQIMQYARVSIAQADPKPLEAYLQRFHETYREAAIVVDSSGAVVASTGGLREDDDAAGLVLDAARAIPQRSLPTAYPWAPDRALIAEPLSTDASSGYGAVVLEVGLDAAKTDVARGWVAVALLGVLLLAALLAASLWWTRWVLRPVVALDAAAHAVSEGREPGPLARTGPPELRRLSLTFAEMTRNVEGALDQQRQFVADASHQLRNPLAATRLRIDGLALAGAGDERLDGAQLDAVQADLDRLDHTIDRMLTLAGAEHRATVRSSDIGDAAADEPRAECVVSADMLGQPHREALGRAGVSLAPARTEQIRVPASSRDLDEIVELLLDNVRKYAGSGATVAIALTDGPDGVVLEIADSGPGLPDAELPYAGTRFWRSAAHRSRPGTGLGLAIVAQLARANAATLTIDRAPAGGLRTRLRWSDR